MKNSGFPEGKHYILQNLHFQEKLEKSSKKPPKILPKSTPNPSKIGKKSTNIDQKSDADLRCETKSEKMRKSGPRPLQKGGCQNLDGIREASSEGLRPSQGRFRREVCEVSSNTLGGPGPPRIGTLRGASRDSAGVLT